MVDVLPAVRTLLRARTEDEVVETVLRVVTDLGGRLEPPDGGPRQLPIDLTFGTGEPLVPAGDDQVLACLVDVVPLLVEDARVALDRIRREQHLAMSATLDALTGLPSRRVVMRVLSRLVPGDTVVLVDLDEFKSVNDSLGHEAGDDVLRAFAHALARVTRAADTAGRLGGEEFVLLLPHTDADGAVAVVLRLRDEWLDTRPLAITFSAGVAIVGDGGGRTALATADHAMYRAKEDGRDRIEVAR